MEVFMKRFLALKVSVLLAIFVLFSLMPMVLFSEELNYPSSRKSGKLVKVRKTYQIVNNAAHPIYFKNSHRLVCKNPWKACFFRDFFIRCIDDSRYLFHCSSSVNKI